MNAQHEWDELLLQGWYRDLSVGQIQQRWFVEMGCVDWDAFKALQRVPPSGDWAHIPVKAVFRQNWPKLNDLLWDGMITHGSAMKRLAKRKWTKVWAHQPHPRNPVRSGTARFRVAVRERDKRSDWHTVK